jgi:uncharacterized protein
MRIVQIDNQSHPLIIPIRADYCTGFMDRFRGLMFRKTLAEHEGLLLVYPVESRVNSAIHMFFMNFDITTIWINSNNCVVDVCQALRWKPFYAPCEPACYVLETHVSQLNNFQPGDMVSFKNV